MVIEQHLVGCTTNVTPETMQKIEEGSLKIETFSNLDGCWIVVMEDVSLENKHLKEPDLKILTAAARDAGCKWVFLDRDCDPIKNLPDYSEMWDNMPDRGLLMY